MDESQLRHPYERAVFAASVVANLLLVAGAIFVVTRSPDWLAGHPVMARQVERFRTIGIVAILLLPVTTVARRQLLQVIEGDSVRVSEHQLPAMHAILEGHCRKLGMSPLPELYVSRAAIDDLSRAYSYRRRQIIVLGIDFVEWEVSETADIISFMLARELGRIRLGHTHWSHELMLAYLRHVPLLRNPVRHTRALSHDRYGAWLAPEAIGGLVALAAGHKVARAANIEDFVRRAYELGGARARFSTIVLQRPPVALRIRELIDAGLLSGYAEYRSPSEPTGKLS